MKKEKNKVDFKFIAVFFLLLIATVISVTSIVFIIGGSINKYIFFFSYMATSYIMYLTYNKKMDKKEFAKNILFTSLIFLFLCFIALIFYDWTWDGNTYHKQMVGLMKNGMNPIYNTQSGDLWARHYANGSEIWSAVIYAVFNNIEAGKVINLILSFSLYILSFNYLYKKTNKKIASNLFAFALTFNPITLSQFHTYYIDSVVLNTLFITIFALLEVYDSKKNFSNKECLIILAASIIICINSKFTALLLCMMFVGLIGGYTVLLCILKKNHSFAWKYTVFLGLVFIFGIFIVGSSSYVKNTVTHKTPFYPLMGEGAVDIESDNEPKSFKNLNHMEKWLYATFSETNIWYDEEPKLKVPFTIKKSEIDSIKYPDVRIGGLGMWYSGIFIISAIILLISLIMMIIKKSKHLWITLLLLFGIIVPIPILPVVWQARYYPEIYLIPFVAIVILLLSNKKSIRTLSYVIMILTVVNGLLAFPQVFERINESININNQLVYLAEQSQTKKVIISQDNYTFYGAYYNYIDKGIKYEYEDERMEKGIPIYRGALYRFEGENKE